MSNTFSAVVALIVVAAAQPSPPSPPPATPGAPSAAITTAITTPSPPPSPPPPADCSQAPAACATWQAWMQTHAYCQTAPDAACNSAPQDAGRACADWQQACGSSRPEPAPAPPVDCSQTPAICLTTLLSLSLVGHVLPARLLRELHLLRLIAMLSLRHSATVHSNRMPSL